MAAPQRSTSVGTFPGLQPMVSSGSLGLSPVEERPSRQLHGLAVIKALPTTVLLLAVYQIFHWFRPAESYAVDWITAVYHLTPSQIQTKVDPWFTYAVLFVAPIIGYMQLRLGYRTALICISAAAIVCACTTIWGSNIAALVVSEIFFAVSFTALYAVISAMYAATPRSQHRSVASLNATAMLIGTILSSAVGFLVTQYERPPVAAWKMTYLLSLGSAVAETILIIVGVALSLLAVFHAPAALNSSIVSMTKSTIRSPGTVAWFVLTVAIRAPHTLILINWWDLSYIVDPAPSAQSMNGLILGVMYVLPTFLVWIPTYFPIPPRFLMPTGIALSTLCGASLMIMSASRSTLQLAIIIIVYNTAAEVLLAICSAQVARTMPEQEDEAIYKAQFPLVMMSKFFIALLWQMIVQAIVLRVAGGNVRLLIFCLGCATMFAAASGLISWRLVPVSKMDACSNGVKVSYVPLLAEETPSDVA